MNLLIWLLNYVMHLEHVNVVDIAQLHSDDYILIVCPLNVSLIYFHLDFSTYCAEVQSQRLVLKSESSAYVVASEVYSFEKCIHCFLAKQT